MRQVYGGAAGDESHLRRQRRLRWSRQESRGNPAFLLPKFNLKITVNKYSLIAIIPTLGYNGTINSNKNDLAKRRNKMQIPTTTKPQPKVDEFHQACQCSKCGGTGFYCQGTHNGTPVSNTGFTCFSCNGTGWRVSWKRGAKKAFWASVEPVKFDTDGNVISVNGKIS
jgi:hypothetical protein